MERRVEREREEKGRKRENRPGGKERRNEWVSTGGVRATERTSRTNLHGNKAVVDHDLLCEEVGTDSSLVLVAEALVDVLVHEGGLSDAVWFRASRQYCQGSERGEERRERTQSRRG
jgi:hypothetical protein